MLSLIKKDMKFNSQQKREVRKTARAFKLQELYLFGSQIKGKKHAGSDLDAAYLSKQRLSLKEELLLIQKLSEVFPQQKIDLLDFTQAPLILQFRIIRDGRVIFSQDPLQTLRRKVRIMSRYYDYRPHLNFLTQSLVANLAK